VHYGRPVSLDAPGHDDIANIGFVVGDRCVAVIDTGGSVRIGGELRTAVAEHARVPICFVVNTHVHVDHVLGNKAFEADHPQFVGAARLAAAMERNRPYFVEHFGEDLAPPVSGAEILGPDRLVADTLELDLGGRRLTLQAWPIAHSDCDLTVLDRKTRSLWTGDLLVRDRLPAVDGSASGWLKVLDRLNQMQVDRTVPGHGGLIHELHTAVESERRYLVALVEGVRRELTQGQSMQHAIDRVALSERPRWLLWESTHPGNVARVYKQLEWE